MTDNIKRVGLYFNLDDAEDKLMFEFMENKKKSRYIKMLILNDIKNSTVGVTNSVQQTSPQPQLSNEELNQDGIDFD